MNLDIIINSIVKYIEKNLELIGNILSVEDIITTFIGSFLAAKLAMKQFKKQEDLKIKEKLRLNFYDEYSDLYKELSISLNELSQTFYDLKSNVRKEWYQGSGFREQYKVYDLMVEKRDDGKYMIIAINDSLEDIENFIKKLKDVFKYTEKMNTLMLENKEIIKSNEKIDYVWIVFTLSIIIKYGADNILEIHDDIRIESTKENCNDKENELERLKRLESIQKKYQEYLTILLYTDIYMDPSDALKKHYGMYKDYQFNLSDVFEKIHDINKVVKYEFIGKYFK